MRMPLAPNATDSEAEADGGCYHLTLAATRALKVLYFDGSSAAKMSGGPMDSQDLVAWGVVREEKVLRGARAPHCAVRVGRAARRRRLCQVRVLLWRFSMQVLTTRRMEMDL